MYYCYFIPYTEIGLIFRLRGKPTTHMHTHTHTRTDTRTPAYTLSWYQLPALLSLVCTPFPIGGHEESATWVVVIYHKCRETEAKCTTVVTVVEEDAGIVMRKLYCSSLGEATWERQKMEKP